MAYQNVGTPRIYLNIPEYLASTGVVIDDVFRTLPVSASAIPNSTGFPDISAFTLTDADGNSTAYVAILGHTATSMTMPATTSDIINGTLGFTLRGFSIVGVDNIPAYIYT